MPRRADIDASEARRRAARVLNGEDRTKLVGLLRATVPDLPDRVLHAWETGGQFHAIEVVQTEIDGWRFSFRDFTAKVVEVGLALHVGKRAGVVPWRELAMLLAGQETLL